MLVYAYDGHNKNVMPKRYRRFFDYIDDRGVNHIQRWLRSLPKRPRVAINQRVLFLEVTEKPSETLMKHLKRDGEGLIELRVNTFGVGYRPLGFELLEEGIVTLLMGSIHGPKGFEPADSLQQAQEMRQIVEKDHARHCIIEHAFD